MTDVLGNQQVPIVAERPAGTPAPEVLRPESSSVAAGQVPSVPAWAVCYAIGLATLDACVLVIAITAGYWLRFGQLDPGLNAVNYLWVGLGLMIVWMIALTGHGAYEIRHLSSGAEEFKRVLQASGVTVALIAVYCYVTKTTIARGFVAGVIPLGALLLVAGRAAARHFVHKRRREGRWVHRILAVGTADSVRHLVAVTQRSSSAGLRVVAACVEDLPIGSDLAPGVPVVGGVLHAATSAAAVEADVVALAGAGLGATSVRELGWQLEGSGRGLVMAPGLTEVAGPRVHVSPVEGLPLMWVDQPAFTGVSRLVKRLLDLGGASFALILASPVLVCAAAAIKLTSRGPVFYRQSRLGAGGTEFMVLKFRSMVDGAETKRAALLELNEQDGGGVLFKIKSDPRITRVGKWLRALSIDELPQLFNVLRGQMSLVGPRPLATIDSNYTGHARRRLLVRPGITGLWQVSGRSDLSWDDAVRLDLFYVENWSLGLDLLIILRTIAAVLRRHGAY